MVVREGDVFDAACDIADDCNLVETRLLLDPGRAVIGKPGERIVARRVEQDATLVEEHDTVGVAQRDRGALLGDDDAGIAAERELEERLRPRRIELRGRLVEQEQLRLERERRGEADALQLAARDLGHASRAELRDADCGERRVDTRQDRLRRRADVLERERDLGVDAPEDDLVLRVLEDRCDGSCELCRTRAARVAARHLDAALEAAAVEPRNEPGERTHERRLAGTGSAEEQHDFAALDLERDVAQRRRRFRIREREPVDTR